MRTPESSSEKLKGFFLGVVRKSFDQLGLGDRQITEYVASVLAEFGRSDRWLALRGAEGRNLTSAVEELVAQLGPGEHARVNGERALRKHVGDYTLFMSGLFRRFVRAGRLFELLPGRGRAVVSGGIGTGRVALQSGLPDVRGVEQGLRGIIRARSIYMRKVLFRARRRMKIRSHGFLRQIQGWVRYGLSDN